MSNDRTRNGSPYQEIPEVTGRVKPVAINGGTLASKLVPVVDKIRQLYTNFGVRPYRVYLVHVQCGRFCLRRVCRARPVRQRYFGLSA